MVSAPASQESGSSWKQDHERGPEVDVREEDGIRRIPTPPVSHRMDRQQVAVFSPVHRERGEKLMFVFD